MIKTLDVPLIEEFDFLKIFSWKRFIATMSAATPHAGCPESTPLGLRRQSKIIYDFHHPRNNGVSIAVPS